MNNTTGGQRKMTRADYNGMYVFQCSCGGKMALNGSKLLELVGQNVYFKCPNQFYSLCNKSYSMEHFKKNALFIAPIIPNTMT